MSVIGLLILTSCNSGGKSKSNSSEENKTVELAVAPSTENLSSEKSEEVNNELPIEEYEGLEAHPEHKQLLIECWLKGVLFMPYMDKLSPQAISDTISMTSDFTNGLYHYFKYLEFCTSINIEYDYANDYAKILTGVDNTEESDLPFGKYNAEYIKWIREHMIFPPDSSVNGVAYQTFYNKGFRQVARISFKTLCWLLNNDIEKHASDYLIATHCGYEVDGRVFLYNKYRDVFPEFYSNTTHEELESYYDSGLNNSLFEYFNTHLSIGFWLRRCMDGSIAELVKAFDAVLKLYDQEWYEKEKSKVRNRKNYTELLKVEGFKYRHPDLSAWLREIHPWVIENGQLVGYNEYFESDTLIIPDSIQGIAIKDILEEHPYEESNLPFSSTGLRYVQLPNSIKEIIGGVFADNDIEELTFPNDLKIIGDNSFVNNNLQTLDIPTSVTAIGNRAFYKNQLKHINLLQCTQLATLGDEAFAQNQIVDISITNTIEGIDNAFDYNPIEAFSITGIDDKHKVRLPFVKKKGFSLEHWIGPDGEKYSSGATTTLRGTYKAVYIEGEEELEYW